MAGAIIWGWRGEVRYGGRKVSVALFIRHGKASAFSSTTDYDQLSAPGVEQSEKLGEWLAAQKLAAVRRHVPGLPAAEMLPELDEHDGIALVFKVLPELGKDDPELAAVVERMANNGGKPSPDDVLAVFKRITRRWVRGEIGHHEVESWAAFRTRVARAMDRVAALGRGKTALVFTSAGAVAAATAEALGVRDEEKVLDLSWSLYNGSITELDFTGERWGLRTFNATSHLLDRRLITSV
jgi:broad specificity phosphatase PhoE